MEDKTEKAITAGKSAYRKASAAGLGAKVAAAAALLAAAAAYFWPGDAGAAGMCPRGRECPNDPPPPAQVATKPKPVCPLGDCETTQ